MADQVLHIEPITIDSVDKDHFKKIGADNILDLAINIPKGYNNYYIITKPQIGQKQLLDVDILSVNQQFNRLQLQCYCHNLNQEIQGVIFNYKPFHILKFSKNLRVFIMGKLSCHKDQLQIQQPQIIDSNKCNKIYPIYKNVVIKTLIDKYVNVDSIYAYGINKTIAQFIMQLHYPTIDFFKSYQQSQGFSKQHLYALKFIEIFSYLYKLQQKKQRYVALYKLNNSIKKWISDLPFVLTIDQKNAIQDIAKDLNSTQATRRIIVGDVGTGKSVIAFAAALIAYPKLSILMSPTTILANQLYIEAKKLLPDYMNIVLITGRDKKMTVDDSTHFIIGTHALLHQDLQDMALVMVDEQHRFGSNQRYLIETMSKQQQKRAHFLQFSATPIPRTMAMIDSMMIDFSFLKITPFKKIISTQLISKNDFTSLLTHIQKQIEQKLQIIIVYPLVQESDNIDYRSIDEAKDFWTKRFDKVLVTFGKDKDKDTVLQKFRDGGNILLATTLVEVGISLDRLSTMVIVGAERLGLSTLHQLRGRVARKGIPGFCFLYSNNSNNKRLQSFCNIVDGFKIAELDLKFRNSGDLLSGKKQSGKQFIFTELSDDEQIISDVKQFLT